jgi:hypothetical protein
MHAFLPKLTYDAAHQALAPWATERPGATVLAFIPEGADLAALQRACKELGLNLFGGVFPAIVHDSEFLTQGAVLLHAGTAPGLVIEGMADLQTCARAVTQLGNFVEERASPAGEQTLFCIFDALDPLVATHLDDLYLRLADLVHYAGVCAGSERFVPIPSVFDTDTCVAGGALALLLPEHPGACLAHGFRLPEQFRVATSASANRVVQIDWQPAIDVYREMVKQQYGIDIDRDNFYRLAVNFPIGILRANDDVLVRIPVRVDDDGGIACIGEIPASAVLTILDAKAKGQDAAGLMAAKLTQLKAAEAGMPLVLFYCAGRRLELGADTHAELTRLKSLTGAAELLGALTLGEVGPFRPGGYPLFHNATMVGLPWPNR